MADLDYDYLGKTIEHAVRDGVESGIRLATDPDFRECLHILRARFAGQAMAALMSREGYDFWPAGAAASAVEHADALLVALGYELPKKEPG